MHETVTAQKPSPQRQTLVALIVGAAFFMEVLDGAIITPAVPEIAKSFSTSAVAVSAGISSYLIAVAIFIPASAWLSDRFGARSVFASAIALFTLASVMCGLSQTLGQFTGARIVQGIAGAMMSPVGRIAVLSRTEKVDILRMMAFVTWPGLTAFIVGPPLGGMLTTFLSWRWIFFINIPLGLVGIALVLTFFERGRAAAPRRFDAKGFILTGGALASLLYGIEGVSREASPLTSAGFAFAGVLLGVAAAFHAVRHPAPLLPVTPFRYSTFTISMVWGGGPFRLASGLIGFLLPVMLQVAFGMSVLDAGLLYGCFLVGDLAIKPLANRAVRLFGFRGTLITTCMLVVVTFVGFILIYPGIPVWSIAGLLVVAGAARSMHFTALNTLTFADLPQDQIGNASTLQSALQQASFGIGVGLAAVVLAMSAQWHGTGTAPTLSDFRAALAVGMMLSVVSALVYTRLSGETGARLRG